MGNKTCYAIISKIEVIKKTDDLINKLRAVEKENSEIDTIKPYELRKQYLVEELLLEMIKARLSFIQFKSLYEKIFAYLDKGQDVNLLPQDLQKEVNSAGQFLEVNA